MTKSHILHRRTWRLRREVTLGALVQLLALAGMLLAAWVNLQKELVLIRHELNQLNVRHQQVQQDVISLAVAQGQHEYRLKTLENENNRKRSR